MNWGQGERHLLKEWERTRGEESRWSQKEVAVISSILWSFLPDHSDKQKRIWQTDQNLIPFTPDTGRWHVRSILPSSFCSWGHLGGENIICRQEQPGVSWLWHHQCTYDLHGIHDADTNTTVKVFEHWFVVSISAIKPNTWRSAEHVKSLLSLVTPWHLARCNIMCSLKILEIVPVVVNRQKHWKALLSFWSADWVNNGESLFSFILIYSIL